MEQLNILITGCGGDIGQSIGKVLKSELKLIKKTLGCDVHFNHPGKFIFDKIFILPKASDKKYFPQLRDIIIHNHIDVIIPTSEDEIRVFYNKKLLEELNGARIILTNKKALQIGLDKLKTINFLEENKFNFPKTEVIKRINNPHFPGVLKSREGSGSNSVKVINDKITYDYFSKLYPDFIFQEYLDGDDKEFTCGLFRNKLGEVANISFRRILKGGISIYGEVVENKEVSDLLSALAEKLNLEGSINVQLRLTDNGPIIFEINPRFSSTVRFRHLLGFKDLIWSIKDKFGVPYELSYIPIFGAKFYKGYEEFVETK